MLAQPPLQATLCASTVNVGNLLSRYTLSNGMATAGVVGLVLERAQSQPHTGCARMGLHAQVPVNDAQGFGFGLDGVPRIEAVGSSKRGMQSAAGVQLQLV
jgi:hypothetical protein